MTRWLPPSSQELSPPTRKALGDLSSVLEVPLGLDEHYVDGYYTSCGMGYTLATNAPTLNNLRIWAWEVARPLTVTQLACRVGTGAATSTIRLGMWRSDPVQGTPVGAPMIDTGALATTSSNTIVTSGALSVVVPAGLYWMGAVTQTAAATMNVWIPLKLPSGPMHGSSLTTTWNTNGFLSTGVTGALPTISRTHGLSAQSNYVPLVWAKVYPER